MVGRAEVEMLADRRPGFVDRPLPVTLAEGDAGQSIVGLGIHRIEIDHGLVFRRRRGPVAPLQEDIGLLEKK